MGSSVAGVGIIVQLTASHEPMRHKLTSIRDNLHTNAFHTKKEPFISYSYRTQLTSHADRSSSNDPRFKSPAQQYYSRQSYCLVFAGLSINPTFFLAYWTIQFL